MPLDLIALEWLGCRAESLRFLVLWWKALLLMELWWQEVAVVLWT